MNKTSHLVGLDEAIGRRAIVPPVPAGKVLKSAEHDDEDSAEGAPDDSASTSCYIEYENAKGETSARTITLRRIEGHYGRPETIGAHCHQSERYKSFRLDRIATMACAYTGEELDPIEHCIALHRDGALKIEDKVLTRVMRVVTFMARCDGELHELETGTFEDILGRYFRFFGGDDAAYDCARRETVRLSPTGKDVVAAVRFIGNVPQAPEVAKFLIDASAQVIDADGQHRDEEMLWGVELGASLRKIIELR